MNQYAPTALLFGTTSLLMYATVVMLSGVLGI